MDKRFEEFGDLDVLQDRDEFNKILMNSFSRKGPSKLAFLVPEEQLHELFILARFPKFILREFAMVDLDGNNELSIEQYNLIKFKEELSLYDKGKDKDEMAGKAREVLLGVLNSKKTDRQLIEKNFAIYFHSQMHNELLKMKYEYWYEQNKPIIQLQPSRLKLDILLDRNEEVFSRGPVEAICQYRENLPTKDVVDAILWNDKVKNLTPNYNEESEEYGTEEYLDYIIALESDKLTRIFKILDKKDVTVEDFLAESIERNSYVLKDRLYECRNKEGERFPFDLVAWVSHRIEEIRSFVYYKMEIFQERIERDLQTWEKIEWEEANSNGSVGTEIPEFSKEDLNKISVVLYEYLDNYIIKILNDFMHELLVDEDPKSENYRKYYNSVESDLNFNSIIDYMRREDTDGNGIKNVRIGV